jgi:hypothetical protein
MAELLSAYDMTDAELRVHMQQRHLIVGFVTVAEHEALHRRGLKDSQLHVHARPLSAKTRVVAAETMDDHTLVLHIKFRHPELQDGHFAGITMHVMSHMLIPAVLDHWHEEGDNDDNQR